MKDIIPNENKFPQEKPKNLMEKYADILPLRMATQLIPYIGGALDTLLSETGNKWREKRMQTLIQYFGDKMKEYEITNDKIISEMESKVNTEEFFDLFLQAGQKSTMTHNKEKIGRFANILKNYITSDISIEEYLLQVFFNITDELSDIEIYRLSELYNEPIEIYYSFRDRPFDIIRLQNDVSKKMLALPDNIPIEYEYDNVFKYSFTRLERLDLTATNELSSGYFDVGWKNNYQSSSTRLQFKKKDIINISDFGKKYVNWVLK